MRTLGLLLIALVIGCASRTSFVRTGTERGPRADDAPVQPFLTGPPKVPFEEIGVVEVRGYTLKDRVDRAAEVARERGGNGVVLLSSKVHVQSRNDGGGMVGIGTFWAVGGVYVPVGATAGGSVNSYEVDRYVVVYLADFD